MGLNIRESKVKVYKGKYGYSCSISNKNQDGSYSNMFMQIQLPKGIEPEDKSIIEITKGFISFYENKDGNKIPKIVVLDFNYINNSKNNCNCKTNNKPMQNACKKNCTKNKKLNFKSYTKNIGNSLNEV